MAIFKRKSKSAKAAEAQPVVEPKAKPEPFRPRHVRTNSNATGQSQPRGDHSDIHLARSTVYGYHSGEPTLPNTPTGRASNPLSRNSSTYFGPPSAPSFDSPILGNPKMAAAARDRGYINPHGAADSGYNSVAASSGVHSRAPSERIPDHLYSRDPQGNAEFALESGSGSNAAGETAYPDNSVVGTTAETLPLKRSPDSVLKSSNGYYTRTDDASDARLEKLTRTSPKQTRFERSHEETPESQDIHLPANARFLDQAQPQASVLQSANEVQQSITYPPPIHQSYPSQNYNEPSQAPIMERGRFPVEHEIRPAEPQSNHDLARPAPAFSAPSIRDESAQLPQPFSPSTNAQRPFVRRGSVPPLSILEGFKVNKRGKILNEEGEPIGELVHGDLMDCVRQKVNAMGEVLDEYGGVVGHVKTLERMSVLQPPSSLNQHAQHQASNHVSPHYQTAQDLPPISQPPVPVTPTAGRQQPIRDASPMRETREVAELPQVDSAAQDLWPAEHQVQDAPQIPALPPSISPLDFEGKDSKYDPPEHSSSIGIIDHSEIFIPGAAPYIPEKSPQRSPRLPPATPVQTSLPQSDPASNAQNRPMVPSPDPPQQPGVATPQSPNTAQYRRSNVAPLLRNLSDSSLSSKSYARPSMTPVPENEGLPDEDRNPARYSYKGEIPAADGPMPGARLPPPPSIGVRAATPQKPNMNGHLPPGQLNGAQYLSIMGAGSRRSIPAPAPGLKHSLSARNSYSQPLKPSPLSSQENSPPDSETSTSDDGKYGLHMAQRPNMGPRQPSISTVASTNNGTGKPRTYFTHTGRVTVATSDQTPTQPASVPALSKNEASVPGTEKTRKRFSLRLGRKS